MITRQVFSKIEAAESGIFLSSKKWDAFNLVENTCLVAQATLSRAACNITAYQYRYFGQFSGLQLYLGDGAWHGSEQPIIFGTSEEVSGIASSKQQQAVSRSMSKAWAAFAKDPEHGLKVAFKWPTVEEGINGIPAMGQLAFDNYAGVSFVHAEVSQKPCFAHLSQ